MNSPSPLALRDYQTAAIQALEDDWQSGLNRCAVVLPTGAGKTVVLAHLAANRHAGRHTQRTLILVHREELARQTVDKFTSVAPDLHVGLVKAERDDTTADIVVASVQTLAREERRNRLTGVDLIIVDECHHAGARTYQEILTHYGAFDDRATLTAGFTATLTRNDNISLGDTWQKVSYTLDILDLIGAGHLVDVSAKSVTVGGLDLSCVAYRGGDYQEASLGAELIRASAGEAIAAAYLQHARDRPGVVFTPTVDAAHHVAECMTAAGIPSASVWGAMGADERAYTLGRYRTGDIQVLVNCMLLTEGWDAPWASCVVIARPTTSAALYVQMVGRVLRPHPGKEDALVLDVVAATQQHKLATIADLSPKVRREERDQDAPRKKLSEMAAEEEGDDGMLASGRLDVVEVEVFDASPVVWLQTPGGIWFVALTRTVLFLWPEGDRMWVGEAVAGTRDRRPTWYGYYATAPEARRFADGLARSRAPQLVTRDAPWRQRSDPPSSDQMTVASRMGLPPVRGESKGALSERISIAKAARTLDR